MHLEDLLTMQQEDRYLMLRELAMIHRGARVMKCKEDLFMIHQEQQLAMMLNQEVLLVRRDKFLL
jgi:hypothetical protein